VEWNLRRISQIIFLLVFAALMILGKVQLWMGIFFVSVAAALFWGRFYCGWICPIHTLSEGIDMIYKKLNIHRRAVPEWAKNSFLKYLIVLLFLGTMVFVLKTGRKLPVLPVLLMLGTITTLLFVPAFWHRYLCPYGILMSMTGSYARHCWSIEEEDCIKCGICKTVCPVEAVEFNNSIDYPKISKKLCLACSACVNACPKHTIKYQ
jgi:polyferredoxin